MENYFILCFLLALFLIYVYSKTRNGVTEHFETTTITHKFNELKPDFIEQSAVTEWIHQPKIFVSPLLENQVKRVLIDINYKTNYDFELIDISDVQTYKSPFEIRQELTINIHDPNRVFGSQAKLIIGKEIREDNYKFMRIRLTNTHQQYTGPTPYQNVKPDTKLPFYGQIPFPFDTPMENARSKRKHFSTHERNVVSQEHVDDVMKDVKSKKVQYMCFGSANTNATNEFDCVQSGGVYDTPVKNNHECPYFNEKTGRGGKRMSGYCEMPQGTKQRGFRFIDESPEFSPLCYCHDGEKRRNCCVPSEKNWVF